MASVWKMLFGSKGKAKQQTTLTPGQQGLTHQLQSGLQGGPSNLSGINYYNQLLSGNPEAFQAFQAPALRQFHEQIVPGIAEQFSGLGMGAQGSSAFQQQLAGAASRLAENLNAQRAGLQMNAAQGMQGYYGQAMQPQFMNYYQQPTQGLVPGLLEGLAQGAGNAFGASLNPMGGFGMGYGAQQYGRNPNMMWS